MSHEMTHRDEIHGDVRYDALAVALLDSTPMQRLGRIYQLGYGHLVYRGGTHTRLSHAMGAYHTAGRLVLRLRENYLHADRPKGALDPRSFLPRLDTGPSSRRGRGNVQQSLLSPADSAAEDLDDRWELLRHLVSWAALVHDVGHIPMGHTLEDEFDGIYQKHDAWTSPRLRHLWLGPGQGAQSDIQTVFARTELYPACFGDPQKMDWQAVWGAVLLICMFKERQSGDGGTIGFRQSLEDSRTLATQKAGGSTLDSAVIEELIRLESSLTGTLFHPYMADIVADTISADFLDYIRRDPHNLGLDVLRDDRVVSRYWVGRDHLRQPRMALSLVDSREKPRLDTCTGVVELVRQRYRLAEIVYYHKTKVSASAMLAKAFHLLGTPPEVPNTRDVPSIAQVDEIVARLMKSTTRAKTLEELRVSCLPTSLLDPEIGDESLPLFLLNTAWERLDKSVRASDETGASASLRAIALLHGLTTRNLYKVAFTMTKEQYARLSGHEGSSTEEVERGLSIFIKSLRSDAAARAGVEDAMVDAAGPLPDSAIILYVPDRKSQAKGIETGAMLGNGEVVTLGLHFAVRKQVQDLGERYASLWKLIVLVHPDFAGEALGLSRAVDALANRIASDRVPPNVRCQVLKEASWFPYIVPKDRPAAELFGSISADSTVWERLAEFDDLLSGHETDMELALGAAVLDELSRQAGESRARELCKDRFASPGSLQARADELLPDLSLSREGQGGAEESLRAAVSQIVRELAGG